MMLSAEYQAKAEAFIRNRASGKGCVFGVVVKPTDPAWHEWQRYFGHHGLRSQASIQRIRGHNGYTVPAKWPQEFDPAWSRESSSLRLGKAQA